MSRDGHGDLHSAWAQLIADALAASGVARAVISPGSRSTPLALALADRLPATVLHDERTAAFFALGQARCSGQASVVLATSGSAPGHWLPAAIEAREAGVPLLLLSADRPWEAREAQSSQTVDQVRLFGPHANAYFELGVPDPHPAALRAVPRLVAQAVLATRYPLAGAVQINAQFRKPLEPQHGDDREAWRDDLDAVRRTGAPRLAPPWGVPDPHAVAELAAQVRAAPRGIVVAGPVAAPQADAMRAAMARFLAASGYVLMAEATSQLRFAPTAGGVRSGAFDALLRSSRLRERLRPDLAVEVGAPAVSAQWLAWIDGAHPPARWVLPGARPADPAGGARAMLLGPTAAVLNALADALAALPVSEEARQQAATYAARWRTAETSAWQARESQVCDLPDTALHEHDVAPLLRQALPPGALLGIGNSSPVRDLEHDLPPDERLLTLLHQRGAAGIDGGVAGAAGARSVCNAPLALLIGDVALLHDAGALAAAAAVPGPLAIVVVHNDGGRIFERLPLGRDERLVAAREALFVVPHGRSFGGLAATWGLGHARADTPAALRAALAQALAADRATLIEAIVQPGGSAMRDRLLAAMAAAGERVLSD